MMKSQNNLIYLFSFLFIVLTVTAIGQVPADSCIKSELLYQDIDVSRLLTKQDIRIFKKAMKNQKHSMIKFIYDKKLNYIDTEFIDIQKSNKLIVTTKKIRNSLNKLQKYCPSCQLDKYNFELEIEKYSCNPIFRVNSSKGYIDSIYPIY